MPCIWFGDERGASQRKSSNRDGDILDIPASELSLGYRTSCIIPKQYVVVEANIRLKEGDPFRSKNEWMSWHAEEKKNSPWNFQVQEAPLNARKDIFAGKLIEDAGLRGFSVGGAQVSEKHCGFVINKNQATAADIIALCEEKKTGYTKKPE